MTKMALQCGEEKGGFGDHVEIYMEENYSWPLHFISYTKINSKKTVDLNVKGKSIKLLRDYIGDIFFSLEKGKNFLRYKKISIKEMSDDLKD